MEQKPNGKCNRIIKKGEKKGEKCNKNCRGLYCTDHKDEKMKTMRDRSIKKHYTKKNLEIIEDYNFKDVQKGSTEYKKKINQIKLYLKSLTDKYEYLKRKQCGYLLCIDPTYKIPLNENVRKLLSSKKFIENERNTYDELSDKEKLIYEDFEDFLNNIIKNYLVHSGSYIIPIIFKGKEKNANIRLVKNEHKMKILTTKITSLQSLIIDLEKY